MTASSESRLVFVVTRVITFFNDTTVSLPVRVCADEQAAQLFVEQAAMPQVQAILQATMVLRGGGLGVSRVPMAEVLQQLGMLNIQHKITGHDVEGNLLVPKPGIILSS